MNLNLFAYMLGSLCRYLLVRSRLHIALYGDSTVRQIFLRLVFFLRGYSVLAEHYYHTDSIYKLNGTHDNLYIGGYDSHEWYQDIDSYPFSIEFIWARRNEILFEQDFISNEPPTRRPTWHIFGDLFHPHLQKKCNCGYNFDFITQLNHTIPFPRFHNVTFFSEVSRDLTKGRHEAAPLVPGSRAETLLHWLRLQWKHQSMTYLPYFEMDQANVFHTNNNRTDVHFQCGIIEFLGSPISGLVKTPLNGDCRDMFNLNLVMILSNVLINIQEYHQE